MAKSWQDIRRDTINTPEREEAVEREKRLLSLERVLFRLRQQLGISQATLADRIGTSQANVSRIEKEQDLKLSTLDGYIDALGGHLEIRAVFPNHDETIVAGAVDSVFEEATASIVSQQNMVVSTLWSSLPVMQAPVRSTRKLPGNATRELAEASGD
jgi:predicted transcriptional regulator